MARVVLLVVLLLVVVLFGSDTKRSDTMGDWQISLLGSSSE